MNNQALRLNDPSVISVLIADDHPVVRAGLRMLIEKADDIAVVAEAGDGQSALDTIAELDPDVSILDIEMPLMTGLEVMRELRKRGLRTASIVLTLFDDQEFFEQAIALGARGYILKDSAPGDIVRGIRAVAAGEQFLGTLAGNAGEKVKLRRDEVAALNSLTAAERRVLRLIADNNSTKDIAADLGISPRTVDHHRASICSKLGVSGTFALIRYALEKRAYL